jgi:hypothetical protein
MDNIKTSERMFIAIYIDACYGKSSISYLGLRYFCLRHLIDHYRYRLKIEIAINKIFIEINKLFVVEDVKHGDPNCSDCLHVKE